MRTIYKYKINHGLTLKIPGLEKVLKVEIQNDEPTAWVICNPGEPIKTVIFKTFETGWNMDDKSDLNMTYLDTVFEGGFVWHIFYRID
jgi:hypothetical protein